MFIYPKDAYLCRLFHAPYLLCAEHVFLVQGIRVSIACNIRFSFYRIYILPYDIVTVKSIFEQDRNICYHDKGIIHVK